MQGSDRQAWGIGTPLPWMKEQAPQIRDTERIWGKGAPQEENRGVIPRRREKDSRETQTWMSTVEAWEAVAYTIPGCIFLT